MKKQSIWVFQWRKSVHYWWSYILFSPECKELTSMLDPLLYRWGVPPVVIRCVHWTMQMGVLQTWIKALGLYIVMFGVRCIYNGPWTCRYTPRHNLKHRTFLFVDIAEVGTHSVLSSNQNQAYIGCRLETLKYWPTLHGIGVYIGVVKSCGVKRLAFYCSNVMSPTFRTYN